MSIHLLDPRRVEQTLGIPYKMYPDGSHTFLLGHPQKNGELLFRDREPDRVILSFGETASLVGGCSITFAFITRVAYDETGQMLIIESHTPSHFAVLHIEPGGCIHLVAGLDETTYKGSIFDIAYRRLTEVSDRWV